MAFRLTAYLRLQRQGVLDQGVSPYGDDKLVIQIDFVRKDTTALMQRPDSAAAAKLGSSPVFQPNGTLLPGSTSLEEAPQMSNIFFETPRQNRMLNRSQALVAALRPFAAQVMAELRRRTIGRRASKSFLVLGVIKTHG